MTDVELAVRAARQDFIEHEGNLSLIGASRLEEVGLSPDHFENQFISENLLGD
jgi:hypothetical protein